MSTITIDHKKEQPLLQRTQIEGTIIFEGATPSEVSLIEQLGKTLQAEADVISLQSIHNQFGAQKAKFMAYTYQSSDARKKYETIPSHLKKKDKTEKKSEAK